MQYFPKASYLSSNLTSALQLPDGTGRLTEFVVIAVTTQEKH